MRMSRGSNIRRKGHNAKINDVWTFTSNGTWTVPDTGRYEIEMHGGGGGGGWGAWDPLGYNAGGGGGGSGSVLSYQYLTKGMVMSISLGTGGLGGMGSGDYGQTGGTTYFGAYSCAGGNGAQWYVHGTGVGGYGSNGTDGVNWQAGVGGSGGGYLSGYGHGGNGNAQGQGYQGSNGAVHITLQSYA